MNRRAVLSGASVVALGSLAGCLSSVFGDDDVEFVGFHLMNQSEEAVSFDAQVYREGEQVYEIQSHTLAGRSGNVVDTYTSECDWEPSAQSFEIRCRETGGEWETNEITAESHEGDTLHSLITFGGHTDGWLIQLLTGANPALGDWFCMT